MFGRDQSGTVAILFGLMLPVLVIAGGTGLEVARALEYKQRLVSATDLTCQQAERWVEATLSDNPKKDYSTEVQAYATTNKSEKSLSNATITATPSPKVKPTKIDVTATGSSSLVLKSLLNKESIPFTVTRSCAVVAATDAPGTLLVSESFEDNHSVARNNWSVLGYSSNATGSSWNGWATTNAGIEINGQAELTGDAIRFGEFFAELDSHCYHSSCTRTNSAMSRKLNLTKGKTYEIRYWYVARKQSDNPYPNKSVICSSSDSDTGAERAQDIASVRSFPDQQTRRVELWVEPYDKNKSNGGYIDFTKRIGGNANSATSDYTDLADVCIWANDWTERKYSFKADQTSEYRITWAAAGREDTYGGLIDYLRICENTCN